MEEDKFLGKAVYQNNHFVNVVDLRQYFGLTKSEADKIFKKHELVSGMIFKRTLLALIVKGAKGSVKEVEKIKDTWDEACKAKQRTCLSSSKREKVFVRDKNKCRYCGIVTNEHTRQVDHVVPWSRGGRDDLDNLVTSCKSCNNRKKDKLLSQIDMELLPVPTSEDVAGIKQTKGANSSP